MKDIVFSTATALASAIREKQVSAMEVLEAHLAQIAARNPPLNAIVTLDAEGARRRAHAADAALARGGIWGPLHGVPLTLKDVHSVAGMRTTAGYEPLAGYVPAEDGTVAARLKSAGAIILGKTNVPCWRVTSKPGTLSLAAPTIRGIFIARQEGLAAARVQQSPPDWRPLISVLISAARFGSPLTSAACMA